MYVHVLYVLQSIIQSMPCVQGTPGQLANNLHVYNTLFVQEGWTDFTMAEDGLRVLLEHFIALANVPVGTAYLGPAKNAQTNQPTNPLHVPHTEPSQQLQSMHNTQP